MLADIHPLLNLFWPKRQLLHQLGQLRLAVGFIAEAFHDLVMLKGRDLQRAGRAFPRLEFPLYDADML